MRVTGAVPGAPADAAAASCLTATRRPPRRRYARVLAARRTGWIRRISAAAGARMAWYRSHPSCRLSQNAA
jgi:hypothetical protein